MMFPDRPDPYVQQFKRWLRERAKLRKLAGPMPKKRAAQSKTPEGHA
jgi:hypothetical protein